MEENIFIKMRKEKFNPDIEPKLKSKEEERENTRFELNTSIYNPITSGVPNKITSIKDLVLEKDIPFDKVNLHKLILMNILFENKVIFCPSLFSHEELLPHSIFSYLK